MSEKKARSSRWVKDAENRTAIVLLMGTVVAAGLFLTALGGGFEGWAVIAGVAAVVLLAGGLLSLRASVREKGAPEPVVYHPDSPDVVLDVDRETGKRSPHKD
ncbi:hypothetical protein [Rhodococcoides yunnanense]|uniref:hypothetical protein n=1 Tax=Rhodococcoides yunnanense TaxID=278209 RepID=UPI000932B156|nr:hypothetical protein [Rhodococcus yunnanensis]